MGGIRGGGGSVGEIERGGKEIIIEKGSGEIITDIIAANIGKKSSTVCRSSPTILISGNVRVVKSEFDVLPVS